MNRRKCPRPAVICSQQKASVASVTSGCHTSAASHVELSHKRSTKLLLQHQHYDED